MICEKVLEGMVVNLRSATLEDAEYTYNIRQDSEKCKYLHPVKGSIETQKEWIKKVSDSPDEYFFVVERKNGEKIGATSMYHIRDHVAEMGRTVLYGDFIEIADTTLVGMDFAYGECGLDRTETYVLEKNNHVLGFNKKFGGKEIKREYDPEFQCDGVYFVTEKEDYIEKRKKIVASIQSLIEK